MHLSQHSLSVLKGVRTKPLPRERFLTLISDFSMSPVGLLKSICLKITPNFTFKTDLDHGIQIQFVWSSMKPLKYNLCLLCILKQGYSISQYHKRKQNKELEKQHLFSIMFMNNRSYVIRTELANQMKMQDTEWNRVYKEKFCSQGVRPYEQ